MPRVRVYEANQVAPASATGARFRPADMMAGNMAAAQGVAGLGQAIGDHAEVQAEIDLEFDDTESRKAQQRYQVEAARVVSEYQLEAGVNAYGKRAQVEGALAKLREDVLGTATNPRMRRMAEERLTGLHAADLIKVGEHAVKEARSERVNVLSSQVQLSGEDAAANWDRPDLAVKHRQTMESAIDELGALEGWGEETLRLKKATAVSGVHRDVGNRLLAIGDISAAQIYVDANADELLAQDELSLRNALKEPMLVREAQGDFDRAIGTMPVPETVAAKDTGPTGMSFEAMVEITAKTESRNRDFNRDGSYVTSKKGARGRMQVMPGTQADPGYGVRPAKDNSAEELARVGRDYLRAMLKRYGGDSAKAWAAYNAGPGAVDAAMREGGDWLSRLPAETRDYVAKNMAAAGQPPTGPQQSPRTWDKAAAYAQIDALADKEGWQPERRERAKTIADREIARDEQLLRRQEDAADREASEWVLANPNFTSLNQMPARIRDRLGPESRGRYMDAAARNAAPKPVAAGGAAALALKLMAIYEPDSFKSAPLGQYAGQLTPGELTDLATKQAAMRTEKPAEQRVRNGITGAIGWAEKYGGAGKLKDEQRAAIYDLMEQDARALLRGGKVLSEDDYNAMFRRATREVPTTTWYGGSSSKPLYDFGAGNIPDADRARIEQVFRRTEGREPTDEEVASLWRRQRARKAP